MSKPELKPCPFCGNKGRGVYKLLVFIGHFVVCRKCEAEGSYKKTELQAINAWNKALRKEK